MEAVFLYARSDRICDKALIPNQSRLTISTEPLMVVRLGHLTNYKQKLCQTHDPRLEPAKHGGLSRDARRVRVTACPRVIRGTPLPCFEKEHSGIQHEIAFCWV